MGLRKMLSSDIKQVVCLYQDSNLFAKKKDITDWTVRGLKDYPDLNFVFEQNKKIIGAISGVVIKNKNIEINDIVVLEKYRHKKIGVKLMTQIINLAKLKKIHRISLWVHWTNAAAIPFYYKLGFKMSKLMQTKKISGVPDGEDVICLEKYL